MIYEGDFLRDAISKLIAEGYVVFAPVKFKDFHIFREIKSAEEADFDYLLPRNSAKIAVFPENEVLMRYSSWIEEIPIEEKKIAIVGIRACDAKAIKLLDRHFLEGFVDPYYRSRREKLLTIAIACEEAGVNCFCQSFGINPRKPEADVVVLKIGEKLFLKGNSDAGSSFLSKFNLKEESDEESKIRQKFEEEKLEMRKIEVDVEKLKKSFDSSYWKEVAINCKSCGICTYLCPTCFCFDIYDEGESRGVRIRAWDSCQFPLHTLESSSHNPRAEKWQRLRNRFYDKFYYNLRKGDFYCVGCGRCIDFCPAGIDIVDVISGVR
uniref:(4Fe-4S)-binding protein n=1 Tax=Archaeoglobus fulgidus TaxID=2234 RepID=A0A7J2THE9_ARCFL